jgi:diguanylate cyclase (GGDEF)-like protein
MRNPRKRNHRIAGLKILKGAISFILPGGLLAAASVIILHLEKVEIHLGLIADIYPPIVYLVSILLGWRFNRSALVFGTISIAVVHWCFLHFGPGHPGGMIMWRMAYNAAALLLPMNLLLLSVVKERGFLTPSGIMRFIFITAQPFLVGMIAGPDPERFVAVLEKDLVPWPVLSGLPVSHLGITAFAAALVVVAIRYYRIRTAKESGIFWALVMLFAALAAAGRWAYLSFYLATASFILLVSVIELSHAMAFKDELTGLPARRALKEDLLKLGSDYCVAMLDIDHFKKFNDKHGHDVGDQVLRMVASRLAGVTGGGKAFRYGGEEFTIIFPGRYSEDALHHLDEVRRVVAGSGFAIRSGGRPRTRPRKPGTRRNPAKRVSVTISIGAAWPDGRGATPDEVLKSADKALYRAKKAGRNRVST